MPLSDAHLADLMTDLGPACHDVAQVVTDESGRWGVLLADGTQVHLALREAPARLELATIVGTLPEEAMQAASTLLMFNLLSHQTGGARIALSPHERDVFILLDLPEATVDLPGLEAALRSLAEHAQTWRAFLNAAPADEFSSHLAGQPEGAAQPAIRTQQIIR